LRINARCLFGEQAEQVHCFVARDAVGGFEAAGEQQFAH